MSEVILAFGGFDGFEGVSKGFAECVERASILASDKGLDFRKQHLDWIEIGRVWREKAQLCTAHLDGANNVRFDTIFSLNFTNPFPYLMDRNAPKGVPIGADPSRTVPEPSPFVLSEIAATDLILYPKCPITISNLELYEVYAATLDTRQRIALSPCWDGLIRDNLIADASGEKSLFAPTEQ